ncbi:ubiquinol oxidase subunit II [Paraburkholderia sp. CNPSo 3272]|uniref:ubiquinol oxidase subunit II n=1 Tax=Paraburkholderia sp. CNPSo 3272 TaxID=2940931 RepID=UPI0020B69011|nr:ubiquinol oxidase subunit II [Paraburkholderia sp. CNPSo 3272]MCP3725809.1 ubiquinol oxidase subunit II [Paraburkholderia sp. CNPSo 3272]
MREICRKFFRFGVLIVGLSSLGGCGWVLLNSKGSVGLQERDLIVLCTGLMLIVVLPAIVLTFVFAWQYRAANHKARYMPEWAHSTRIEAVVWGIPILIIVTLATIVWKSTNALDPYRPLDVPGQPINVEVIATDWKWIFIYPDLGIATINQLVFPAHREVAFSITSNSTMGTFFIPQLGGQIYAMAGMRTQLHLMANEEGKFRGMSGNFNGPGFSDMKFIATATSEDDFQRWVKQVQTSPNRLDFNTFQKVATPSQGTAVVQFSRVQPGLFRAVIDQFVAPGADAAAHTALNFSASSKREE